MRQRRGRVVEVRSVADLDRRLAAAPTSLSGWWFAELDLSGRDAALATNPVAGATFLGCTFAPGRADDLTSRGALVLGVPDAGPTAPPGLYSPADLYDQSQYADTYDARTYAWSRRADDPEVVRVQWEHDYAIDAALAAWVQDRQLVGVMGGHAVRRGEPAYEAAARFGHTVGEHLVVATGGGPGAMEAANLGGYLSGHPEDAVATALEQLGRAPDFRPSVDAWLAPAREVLATVPDGRPGLGIPTWHYGHEPSNVFATASAKYFRNALREAILLQVCDAGIVFLPGVAGTVQEVFQDACENYYADESSVAPMVLVGVGYWTEDLPAWPLLRALARGRPMEEHVHLVDTVKEAASLLEART